MKIWYGMEITELVSSRHNDKGTFFGYDFTPVLDFLKSYETSKSNFVKYDFHIETVDEGNSTKLGKIYLIFQQMYLLDLFIKRWYGDNSVTERLYIHRK